MEGTIDRGSRRWWRVFRSLLLFGVVCSVVVGQGQQASAQESQRESVKLVTLSGHVSNLLPLDVALGLDLFAKHGLDVEVIYVQGGSDAAVALLSGSADFAVMSVDHVVKSAVQGKRLLMVGMLNRYPGCALVVRTELAGEVHSPRDLVGRTAGVSATGSTTHMILNHLVRRSGGDPSQIKIVNVALSAMPVALERGQVDCGITWEPVTTAVVDRGIARILTDLNTEQACRDFFGGEYAQAGLIAQPETVDARSGVLAKVLAAFDEALQWMAGHDAEEIVALIPQEAVADRATYARALSRQKFIFPASTKVDPRAMENVVAFFREAGMIPAGMPLRAQDFLRPAATARAAVPGVGPLKGKDGVLQPVVLVGAVLGLLLVVVLVVLSRTKKRGARG